MSSNKGITLVVLVTIIILLLILSGTATYVGYNTIQNSAEQRFSNQLQEINEAVSIHSKDYESLELTKEEHKEDEITYNYVLSTEEDYKKIGLYNIKDTVYVNFKDGLIYSKNGVNGKHTLKDFGIEYYKPTQEEKNISNDISFDVTLEPQEYSWKYVVNSENIICSGKPLEGNLLYAEYKEDKNKLEWKRVAKLSNGFELEIKDPGIYELKYRDVEGKESDVKEIYAYVKDGLELYLDGEYNENYKHNETATIWKDLSGNDNNGTMNGGTWNEKSVIFDGEDDWTYVDNVLLDIKSFTIENVSNKKRLKNWEDLWGLQSNRFVMESNKENSRSFYYTNSKNIYVNDIAELNKIVYNSILVENNKVNSYKNGLKKYENVELLNDINTSGEKFGIAADGNGNYNSKIDYNVFRIYNRKLSENEIEQNYNIDKVRYNISE